MTSPSPTRDGFRAMFALPYVGIIEVLWRWSFGAIFGLLAIFCFAEYLQSLPISREQLFLLGSGQSMLALKALQQIFQGSAPRLIRAFLLLASTATFCWIALAAIGRAATLRPLIHNEESKVSSGSLLGLNVLRALAFVLTSALTIAIFVLLYSSKSDSDSAAAGMLLSFALIVFVWGGWGVWNWFFAVAVIFVAKENCGTFSALARASDLTIKRFGAVFAVSFWFGLAKVTAWYVVGLFCFVLIGVAPLNSAAAMAALITTSLGYFLLADFLYVGRLAGYLSITDLPEKPAKPKHMPFAAFVPPAALNMSAAVDPDELILSDHPEPAN
jgi:hypothetical protein